MHTSRFDHAIVGDSLAARMTSAMLAKHGKRVLLLTAPSHHDPWQHSTLFTEKLLGTLGGRDCFAPYAPFQVLSNRARVTIQPELPLADELSREFGDAAPIVNALLGELECSGNQLEDVLWEHGGLPTGGLRNTATWRWLCLRRKLPVSSLTGPLGERLRNLPEVPAEWLRDLFQGLSLQPLEALTVADGALLWAHACRPEGVNGEALRQLLQKRLEQFHGVEIGLDTLTALEHNHQQWVGSLQNGSSFQAQQLLLGDLGHNLPGQNFSILDQLPAPARHFETSALDGKISALLKQRFIAGGSLPLRMTVTTTTEGLTGKIGCGASTDESQIRRQLEPVLPFARYTLEGPVENRQMVPSTGPPASSLFKLPILAGSQLWCADETRLLPQFGTAGAALLAWTLLRHLNPAAMVHGS